MVDPSPSATGVESTWPTPRSTSSWRQSKQQQQQQHDQQQQQGKFYCDPLTIGNRGGFHVADAQEHIVLEA
jgi:hypothetical protein